MNDLLQIVECPVNILLDGKTIILLIFGFNEVFTLRSGIFEVNFSKDIKIQGILGPCASLEKVYISFWIIFVIYLLFDIVD